MSTKKQAQVAKAEIQKRLGDTDASVGLTTDKDGSYIVAVRFKSKPTKKFVTTLTKGLDVSVETEVIDAVMAQPAPKKVAKKAAKKASKKSAKKTPRKPAAKKTSKKSSKK